MIHKILTFIVIGLLTSPLFAAEKTIVLDVEHMTCPVCPITVKKSLERVDGVKDVTISFADKTASVTFDDAIANDEQLTKATTNAGYPSKVRAVN